ncbi:MAG: hypothetical protein KDC34_20340 [Saprospiraceae bacterium]|nr:hypothetical protein [Saprospiraceae bacterium]
MSFRSFVVNLFSLTLLTVLVLYATQQVWPLMKQHQLLSWLSLGFFFLLSVLMYWTGLVTSRSENKNMFTAAVLGFVFGKMALSLMIVVIYTKEVQPESKYFILPFFLVYLVYTVFETYFLIRLGKQKLPENNGG